MVAAVLDLQERARVVAAGGERVVEARGGVANGEDIGDEDFGGGGKFLSPSGRGRPSEAEAG
jgi:hypothetical protein